MFNVGIEGLMLIGAFMAVWGADFLGSRPPACCSPWLWACWPVC